MSQKRIASKDCGYKGFKFNEKHHSALVKRRNLLGQSIEWQVNEATKEFIKNYAYELEGKEKEEVIYKYRTFKFKKKIHQIMILRRELLGEIIEWQLNKAVEDYLNKNSKELEEREEEAKKEIEETKKEIKEEEKEKEITEAKEKEEAKEKNENPEKEPESEQGGSPSIPAIPAE